MVLHLPACHSLKEKRSVMQSVVADVRRKFQVAVAEIEEQDRHQTGVLGLACVSNDVRHVDSVLTHAANFLADSHDDADLVDYQTEVVHVL